MDDAKFILNPGQWPRWPVLPLVRRFYPISNGDSCGLLLDGLMKVPPYRVYFINVFRASEFKDARYVDYHTVQDLVKEWRVD